MTAISIEVKQRIRNAILAPSGVDFMNFISSLHFDQESHKVNKKFSNLAIELGLCSKQHNDIRLTKLGWALSDSAREYINWIKDGRSLKVPNSVEIKGKRVLDVGCGWGRHVLTLAQFGNECVGIEPNEVYVQIGKIIAEKEDAKDLRVLCGNAENLPFKNDSFDIVWCLRSFAYMNQRHALGEFSRVLRPGGRLVIATPTIEMWLDRWKGNRFTTRKYSKRLRWLVNSYCVLLFGNRPFFLKPGLKNPSYPALSYMEKISKSFRFELVEPYPEYVGETPWFILKQNS